MKVREALKRLHIGTMDSMRKYNNKNLYTVSCEFWKKFFEFSRNKYQEWEEANILTNKNCPICNSDHVKLVLERNLDSCRYNKCLNCEFVYANPNPPSKYYDEIYKTGYDGIDAWWSKQLEKYNMTEDKIVGSYPAIEMIKKRKKNGSFMDYGCGSGWVLNKVKDTFDIYGVDLDIGRINEAREKIGDQEGDKIKYYEDIEDSHYKEMFDVIHANQTIEHLLDPIDFLKKMHRWLKPDGIIYLCAPASDSFGFSFLKENYNVFTLGHVSLFNKKSILCALTSVGFDVLEFRQEGVNLSAIDFWKKIFYINFLHRTSYIDSNFLIVALYPIMLFTTGMLALLTKAGVLKGTTFYVFAQKKQTFQPHLVSS